MPYESKKFRSQGRIVADVLQVSKNKGGKGATKTEIMYRGKISFDQLNLYISGMVEAGLLIENPVRNSGRANATYSITDEGERYIRESPFTLGKLEIIGETMQRIKNSKVNKGK